jgi:hypothetical protein
MKQAHFWFNPLWKLWLGEDSWCCFLVIIQKINRQKSQTIASQSSQMILIHPMNDLGWFWSKSTDSRSWSRLVFEKFLNECGSWKCGWIHAHNSGGQQIKKPNQCFSIITNGSWYIPWMIWDGFGWNQQTLGHETDWFLAWVLWNRWNWTHFVFLYKSWTQYFNNQTHFRYETDGSVSIRYGFRYEIQFFRYEVRYEFISDLISVFLICSGKCGLIYAVFCGYCGLIHDAVSYCQYILFIMLGYS